jgi:hypothetical protein
MSLRIRRPFAIMAAAVGRLVFVRHIRLVLPAFLAALISTGGLAQTLLHGKVQENVSPSPGIHSPLYDEFSSGGADCDWNTGACDMLKGMLAAGVTDSACLDPIKEGVEDERQEHALARQAPRSGHDPALDKRLGELEQARDAALRRVPRDCLEAGHGHAQNGSASSQPPPNPPVFQGSVDQSNPAQPIRALIKGFADQSQAKGFPAQTTADTLSQEPDPLIAAAGPCAALLQTAVANENEAVALRARAAQNPSMQSALDAQAEQAFVASRTALDQFNGCLDRNVATAPITPVSLAGLAKKLAPHYDLRNPGDVGRLGVDIIGGYLVNKGLGYVLPFLPAGLSKVFGKTGEPLPPITALPPATPEWQIAAGSSGPSTWPAAVSVDWPPGIQLPKVIENTLRPVHLQEQPTSCVLACVRMVAETILRRPVSEATVLQHLPPGAFDPNVGTQIGVIAHTLQEMGVPASLQMKYSTIDDLAAAVKDGYPAIVRVGDATSGHGVIVDAVVGQPGSRYFFIRDPLNPAHLDPTLRQVLQTQPAGFRNAPILTEQQFNSIYDLGQASPGGFSMFTHP